MESHNRGTPSGGRRGNGKLWPLRYSPECPCCWWNLKNLPFLPNLVYNPIPSTTEIWKIKSPPLSLFSLGSTADSFLNWKIYPVKNEISRCIQTQVFLNSESRRLYVQKSWSERTYLKMTNENNFPIKLFLISRDFCKTSMHIRYCMFCIVIIETR